MSKVVFLQIFTLQPCNNNLNFNVKTSVYHFEYTYCGVNRSLECKYFFCVVESEFKTVTFFSTAFSVCDEFTKNFGPRVYDYWREPTFSKTQNMIFFVNGFVANIWKVVYMLIFSKWTWNWCWIGRRETRIELIMRRTFWNIE